jgi:hypothetical protein
MATSNQNHIESRWEAAPAVVLLIALQVALALVSRSQDWPLGGLAWWVWLIPVGPEAALLAPLAFSAPHRTLQLTGRRRAVEISLLGVVLATNALLVGALVRSLLLGDEKSGDELLFKALTVWSTNVIVFGLLYWALDRGGPDRRRTADPPPPDFQFPQMENPSLAEPGWQPRLVDYIYVSFTNSLAFSPTDVMPLTRRAKMLMMFSSAASALTVLLAAARAVNIIR